VKNLLSDSGLTVIYTIGFELSRSNTALKAYFLPETVTLTTGTSKFDLISGVVRKLCEVPSSSSAPISLQKSWDMLLGFFGSLPPSLTPSIEIVAVDCVPSSVNRLKVYIRTPLTTLSTVKRFMTLDSVIESTAINRALEQVSYLWEILFPGLSDDKEPGVGESQLRHPTGGLLFYYELRGDSLHPLPKIYLPVRHLCKNDEEIVKAMEKLYRKTNNLEALRNYGRMLRDTL
jgi:DMATS type aromatic prenyltransferase